MRFAVLLVSVVFSSLIALHPVYAQTDKTADPNDYFVAELIGGSVGALGGGVAGGAVGALADILVCPALYPGKSLACDVFPGPGAGIGYIVGIPVGTVIGVYTVGSMNHAQGNLWLSSLGALVGESVGVGITVLLINLLGYTFGMIDGIDSSTAAIVSVSAAVAVLVVVPVVTALGAVIGYNVGATVEQPPPTPVSPQAESSCLECHGYIP